MVTLVGRSWSGREAVSLLLVVLTVIGCASKGGLRRYDVAQSETVLPDDYTPVHLYLSTLEAVDPYVHRFPTGYASSAPNLDPRRFVDPKELTSILSESEGMSEHSHSVGPPDREFVAVGEVYSSIKPKMLKRQTWGTAEYGVLRTDKRAPNGAFYYTIEATNWSKAVQELQKQAAGLQADAIVECFCGSGVSGYWHPPTTTWVPVYGGSGTVGGGYVVQNPAMTSLSGWQIMGLAVRWTDGTTDSE
ncbi:MAG: hypothetical protein ABIK65_11425 [Candidatus Eisenbacteria bacterium]